MSEPMAIWVIYDSPSDFPDLFVARKFIADGSPEPKPTAEIMTALDLEGIREQLPPGLARFPRAETDDPVIVECWL